jgi:hypothetical protein
MAKKEFKAFLCFDERQAPILSTRRPSNIIAGKYFEFPDGAQANYVPDDEEGGNIFGDYVEELKAKRVTIIVED